MTGLAYSNLVYDWVKAAVMFGVINTIARLDHLDPPQPPKCITMLYIFAETKSDGAGQDMCGGEDTWAVLGSWSGSWRPPETIAWTWPEPREIFLGGEKWIRRKVQPRL
ncbi:hypothetical protein EK904_013954 [Melospiza melodia maxima]|nr:hypothetical protein EK904_013954 [Melospiza melodia maxima]